GDAGRIETAGDACAGYSAAAKLRSHRSLKALLKRLDIVVIVLEPDVGYIFCVPKLIFREGCIRHPHDEAGKHSIDILIIGGFTIEPTLNERVSDLVFIQVTRHPAKGEKGLRDRSHRESLERAIIMQYPQTHVISCANQASLLQIHDDDCEHAD